MEIFTKNEIIILFISMSLMLGFAWITGEALRRLRLPAVAGEILAGIMLGPTIFGRISPDIYSYIFPAGKSAVHVSIETFILMGAVLLLLAAGLEVELTSVIRQGKQVIIITLLGIAIPFIMGSCVTVARPDLFGVEKGNYALSLFIGISVSITALPLIARILMNMQLLHSDFGMLIITSAVLTDLTGWLLFSILIQLMQTGTVNPCTIFKTVLLTLAVSVLILTSVRYLINRALPWIQANTEWPGGIITLTIIICFILSAMSESIGLNSIFGAFLAGIAIGDSPHMREQTRNIITQFVDNIFAPLFFVSIGLRIDFIDNFSLTLPLLFLAIIFTGKFSSAVIASRFTGMKIRDSLAVASGMSSGGAMGIILGIFALQNGLINTWIFEAIVITATVTSLASGPMIKFFLKQKETIKLIDLVDSRLYIRNLKAADSIDAIKQMCGSIHNPPGINPDVIAEKVIERENMMSTGIGNYIAVPHARLPELKKPLIIAARSESGVDFDAIDGKPAKLIFMVLSPRNDQQSQIQILSDISVIFHDRETRDRAIRAKSFNEFVSSIKPAYYK